MRQAAEVATPTGQSVSTQGSDRSCAMHTHNHSSCLHQPETTADLSPSSTSQTDRGCRSLLQQLLQVKYFSASSADNGHTSKSANHYICQPARDRRITGSLSSSCRAILTRVSVQSELHSENDSWGQDADLIHSNTSPLDTDDKQRRKMRLPPNHTHAFTTIMLTA